MVHELRRGGKARSAVVRAGGGGVAVGGSLGCVGEAWCGFMLGTPTLHRRWIMPIHSDVVDPCGPDSLSPCRAADPYSPGHDPAPDTSARCAPGTVRHLQGART